MAPSAISPKQSILSSDGSTYPIYRDSVTVLSRGYRGYDHITWYVGNAKQAATYYTTRMGFKLKARKGLETGSRFVASHVVSNGSVTFVLTSPLQSSTNAEPGASKADKVMLDEIHTHLRKHGDAVKDVAFAVDDVKEVFQQAVDRGAKPIQALTTLSDHDGEVLVAIIKTFGDTTHTLIQRSCYHGAFLPGYRAAKDAEDPLVRLLPPVSFEAVDHCVGNQDWESMETVCE